MTTEVRRLRNYINGEFRDAADGRTIDVVNPVTEEVYATSPSRDRPTSTPPWTPPRPRSPLGATSRPPSARRPC